MRGDMKDLLLNTGRSGSHGGYERARFKNTDPDLLPRRFSVTEFIYDRRSQGDRLRPLYRYLERNCGRLWSKVYAEIVAVTDYRSLRGHHLLEHVRQYVLPTNHKVGFGYRRYGPFFVDTHGILQKERTPSRAERRQQWEAMEKREWDKKTGRWVLKKIEPRVFDTDDHWWTKIEGYWYEFTVTHVKHRHAEEFLIDKGNNEVDIGRRIVEHIRDYTKKRQVDSRTSKKLEAEFAKKKAA